MKTRRPFIIVVCGFVLGATAISLTTVGSPTPTPGDSERLPLQPASDRSKPFISLQRIEQDGVHVDAVFRVVNPTNSPIYIFAEHFPDDPGPYSVMPVLSYQRLHGRDWEVAGRQWCFSTDEPFPIKPNQFLEFRLCLTEKSDWVIPNKGSRSLADYREPIRAGLQYRVTPEGPGTQIWSPLIPAERCRPKRTIR